MGPHGFFPRRFPGPSPGGRAREQRVQQGHGFPGKLFPEDFPILKREVVLGAGAFSLLTVDFAPCALKDQEAPLLDGRASMALPPWKPGCRDTHSGHRRPLQGTGRNTCTDPVVSQGDAETQAQRGQPFTRASEHVRGLTRLVPGAWR